MFGNRKTLRAGGGEQGFTLIEVTIILLVLVILSTIILPQLGKFNRLARFVKVTEDLVVLCSGMKKMLDEVMENSFWVDPVNKNVPVGLLFTDGDIPKLNPGVLAMDDTAANWQIPNVNDPIGPQPITDYLAQIAGNLVADHFMNHFLMNDPIGILGGQRYIDVIDVTTEWWAFGWHGPYFHKLMPDPWGNRYVSNVFALHSISGNIYTSAVVVLSAGPNEVIDTKFDMFYKSIFKSGGFGPGFEVGLDDQVCVLSGGGPF